MFRGNVSYRAGFPGIEFSLIEFVFPDALISKATIESSATDKRATCVVQLDGVPSVEALLEKADATAASIQDIATFHFGAFFRPFVRVESSLVEEQPGGTDSPIQVLGSYLHFDQGATCIHKIAPAVVADLKAALEQPHHRGQLYYEQFRSALGLSDPISKFMALYGIVLALRNDQQSQVDAFIHSVEPNVSMSPIPPRSKSPPVPAKSPGNETIYTRLRNQIGHVRFNTTVEGTRNEMADNLCGLTKIVQELIRRQP